MRVTIDCRCSLEELSFAVANLPNGENDSYEGCVALDTADRLLRDVKSAVVDAEAGANEAL